MASSAEISSRKTQPRGILAGVRGLSIPQEELSAHKSKLLALDAAWSIDSSLIEFLRGSGGQARLEQLFMSTLPTQHGPFSIEQGMMRSKAVLQTELYEFAAEDVKSLMRTALGLLQKIEATEQPLLDKSAGPWLHGVHQRCENFFFGKVNKENGEASSSTSEPKVLVGRAWLLHSWNAIETQSPEKLGLSQLAPLLTMRHLLDAKIVVALEKKAAECRKALRTRRVHVETEEEKKKKQKKNSSSSMKSAREEALSMFR